MGPRSQDRFAGCRSVASEAYLVVGPRSINDSTIDKWRRRRCCTILYYVYSTGVYLSIVSERAAATVRRMVGHTWVIYIDQRRVIIII